MVPSAPGSIYTTASDERQRHVDAVIGTAAAKRLVVAGPGTGKTYLFRHVLAGKSNTLTLTFVNALVEDLSLELFGLSDVRTLHGFARQQLEKITRKPVAVFPQLSRVIGQDAEILLAEAVNFDRLLHKREDCDPRLAFYKKRRRYYNHFGFCDLVYTAALYFELHPDRIPRYTQIVVDEFQDFNLLEVSLIDLLARRSPVLLAGDDDQALYESLKDASPRHIRERHCGDVDDYACFSLPFCSRCTRVIVDATNDIITGARRVGLLAERIDKPFLYFRDPKKDEESNANPYILQSNVFAGQIPWFIQKQISDITGEVREKFSVLILSPTRQQCRSISDALRAKGFQNVHFAERPEKDEPSLLDGLKLLIQDGKCNLGWRIVCKALLQPADFEALLRTSDNPTETKPLVELAPLSLKKRVGGMLTCLRKVRDGKKLPDEKKCQDLFAAVGIDGFTAVTDVLRDGLQGLDQRVVEPGIRRTSIVVTTIQSSKGLAADYVFITHVDDRFCIKDEISGMSDQDVCSFLVALTRARRRVYLLSTDENRSATFITWLDESRIQRLSASGAVSQ